MTGVLLGYLALLGAMLLPIVGFAVRQLSDAATDWMLLTSMGLVVAAFLGSLARAGNGSGAVAWHLRRQRSVLTVLAVGGVVASLRLLLKYEQVRLRIDLDWPLLIAAALLWALAAALVCAGLLSLLWYLLAGRTSAWKA